ncbi:hypothetical protein AVEN_8499-1 [Araneus ventricosus]|uniref:Pre-C2HC domain-containing protein n=1 Tax=Araneus ventricosus TaxID=182803 RepID=A0A4Y2QSJ6_ARAVE|nr:hypothetical protein AVEN_8499-1 [Araneus ventricosus]
MSTAHTLQNIEMEDWASHSKNLFRSKLALHDQIICAAQNGAHKFNIFFQAASGNLPQLYPKQLKDNLTVKLRNVKLIDHIQFTRQNRLLISTEHLETAIEISNIKAIMGIPTVCSVISEQITSSFLLRNVPLETSLQELTDELEAENTIKIHEARRFLSDKSRNIATENVLVTTYGTNLPQHIKLWLTRQEISLFIDKPRQCRKCFSFSHPTSKCKNESICEICGEQHNIQSCTSPTMNCILCKGPHKATDLKCPKREERKFLKFKCLNRLSFIDARRKFQIDKKSYSSVVLTSQNDLAQDKTHYVTKEELTQILNQQMLEQKSMFMEMINSQALLFQQTMDKYNEHIMKNISCITLALKNITEETLKQNGNEVKRPSKSKKTKYEVPNLGTDKQFELSSSTVTIPPVFSVEHSTSPCSSKTVSSMEHQMQT